MALKRLLLVDVNPLLYRVAFASKADSSFELTHTFNGVTHNTTILNGFCHTVLTAIEEVKPSHVCLAKDWKPTQDLKRTAKYPMYKSSRHGKGLKDIAPKLHREVQYVNEVMPKLMQEGFGVQTIESEGHEADDIIGTFTTRAREEDMEVVILSNDNDFVQLLTDDSVKIWTHNSNHEKWEERTKDNPGKRFKDIDIEQFLDFQALAGDPSDSIPGCPGVGPKRASQLLRDHGNLENIFKEAPNMKKSKMRENLTDNKDYVYLYRELVELEKNVEKMASAADLLFLKQEDIEVEGKEERIRQRKESFEKAPNKTLKDLEVVPKSKAEAQEPFKVYDFQEIMERIRKSSIFQDELSVA